MNRELYRDTNLLIALACSAIEKIENVDDVIDAQNRADALGPLIDPTIYREKLPDFIVDQERAKIIKRAQVSLHELRQRYGN